MIMPDQMNNLIENLGKTLSIVTLAVRRSETTIS